MPQKQQYTIENMSCASCVKKIQSTLDAMDGVHQADVNFAQKSVTVEGDCQEKAIIKALADIGYQAKAIDDFDIEEAEQEEQQQFRHAFKQFIIAGIAGIILMILGMGAWLPPVYTSSGQAIWFVIGLVTLSLMIVTGGHFYRSAWTAFRAHYATMDTLIALGTGAAWIFSQIITIVPQAVPAASQHVYFEASLMIIALVNLGNALEVRARGKTSAAIKRLIGLQAKTARVIRDDKEIDIPIEAVKEGDLLRARPGEKIAVDGVIVEGHSNINEAMLTGEPMPVRKAQGDKVIGATLNESGSFIYRATHVGSDTALAQIIQMVQQAQNTKPPIAKLADFVSGIFVPVVLMLSVITALVWFNFGPDPKVGYMLVTSMTVLIIACPCALGLAAPISVMVGMGKAAEYGSLIRNGEALQQATHLDTILLDKTGTITEGHPDVTQIVVLAEHDEQSCLQLASSVEQGSEHPLAQAILSRAEQSQITLKKTSEFEAVSGQGVQAKIDGAQIVFGNDKLMQQHHINTKSAQAKANAIAELGQTPMYLAQSGQLIALIAVADPIKQDAAAAIARLQKRGLKVMMITGDHHNTAQAVAKQVGIDEVIADVLPQDKASQVKRLQAQGMRVAMVGDGVNDAPALAQADVGFAIGSGTDVAIESADITLIRNSLHGVADAIAVSGATMRNIKQNLWGAFLYNSLGIPIAAGVLYPFLGLLLSPIIAGGAMALSSVTVVSNANRLRWFKAKGAAQ